MHRSPAYQCVRSLAQVKRDEDVEIGHIAFDSIRERCPALGLQLGAVVRCVASHEWDLVLRTAADTEVVIDRFHAAFIEVRPVDPSRSLVQRGDGARLPRSLTEAADGRVTLKGTVRSLAERLDAESAAWSAPGVTSVDDRIAIQF